MALPEYEKRVNKLKELEKTNKYSFEGVFTGEYWVDGRPIYRKTYNLDGLPAANSIKQIELNLPNASRIIDGEGYAYNPENGSDFTFPLISNTASSSNMTIVPNLKRQLINIYSNNTDNSPYTEAYLTLKYIENE